MNSNQTNNEGTLSNLLLTDSEDVPPREVLASVGRAFRRKRDRQRTPEWNARYSHILMMYTIEKGALEAGLTVERTGKEEIVYHPEICCRYAREVYRITTQDGQNITPEEAREMVPQVIANRAVRFEQII